MLVHIEHKVKPTDAQKASFEDFKTATRQAAEKLRSACPKDTADKDADAPKTRPSPIERLARTQTTLEASLEAIKIVRPAAEKFYASLNDEQKAKLTQPRGPRFGHRGHGPKGGPDDEKSDGPETPAPAPRD